MEVTVTIYEYKSKYGNFEYYNSDLILADENTSISQIFKRITNNDDGLSNKTFLIVSTGLYDLKTNFCIINTDKNGDVSKIVNSKDIIDKI